MTVRLLDPPLHEFIPHTDEDIDALAASSGIDADKLKRRAKELHETNPMLGHRGCRLGVAYPEIYEMQVRAIFEAAADCTLRKIVVKPEIMIPLTGTVKELEWIQPRLERIAKTVMEEKKVQFTYKFGTMIEIPRAAITADEIAEVADFFSFGTNDLTQMLFGFSRDDVKFLIINIDLGGEKPFLSIIDKGGLHLWSTAAVNSSISIGMLPGVQEKHLEIPLTVIINDTMQGFYKESGVKLLLLSNN